MSRRERRIVTIGLNWSAQKAIHEMRAVTHRRGTLLALVAIVGLLQCLDLHSSLTARASSETNGLVNALAVPFGSVAALFLAKVAAFGSLGCLYWVWRRCPPLRSQVNLALAAAGAVYLVVVANNYGAV